MSIAKTAIQIKWTEFKYFKCIKILIKTLLKNTTVVWVWVLLYLLVFIFFSSSNKAKSHFKKGGGALNSTFQSITYFITSP